MYYLSFLYLQESTNALLEGIRAVRPSKSLLSIIPRHEAMKNVSYLKQHLFEACFTIAKHFNSDEVCACSPPFTTNTP